MAIPPGDASNLCLASGGAGQRLAKEGEKTGGEWELTAFSEQRRLLVSVRPR